MKNLNSLVIISCLLFVLVGGCKSDMFNSDKGKDTPTPTTTPTATTSPSSTPKDQGGTKPSTDETPGNRNRSTDSENPNLATGEYTGTGKNVTLKKTGDFLLRVDSVDSAGNVKAYFEASNGLSGYADMTGTITKAGKLNLSGTMDDDRSVAVIGTVSGSTISAGFGLADSDLKTESGNLTLRRR